MVDRKHTAAPAASSGDDIPGQRVLTAAAKRALAEAEERRRRQAADATGSPREVGGQAGPDPTRYGDWEKGGIASDF